MRKKCINKIAGYLLLTLVVCMLQGCIGDDVTSCHYDGVHFFFKYDLNVEGTDQFEKEPIKKIGLYVFDEQGLFYGYFMNDENQISTKGYRFRLSLPTGRYSFVAWAQDNTNAYTITDLVPGSTSIRDVRLKLNTTQEANAATPGLLLHGRLDGLETSDQRLETATFNLEKNVNELKINLLNLPQKYSLSDTQVAVSLRNGEYKFDNTIAENAQLLSYTPLYTPHELGKTASLRVLQMKKGIESRLKIVTKLITGTRAGEEVVLMDRSLIELIALNPEIDFEREHNYNIDLDFGNNVSLIIKVNDWIVSDGGQEIE